MRNTTTKTKNNMLGFLMLLLLLVFPFQHSLAQQRINNGGRLDANLRLGSGGKYGNSSRINPISGKVDYVTGNVTGGARFQGLVPYRSMNEFQGTIGSSTLSDFRRDSYGIRDSGAGVHRVYGYVDPSRAITGMRNGNIVSTSQLYRSPAAVSAANAIKRRFYYKKSMPLRPLSGGYSNVFSEPIDMEPLDFRVPLTAKQRFRPAELSAEPFRGRKFDQLLEQDSKKVDLRTERKITTKILDKTGLPDTSEIYPDLLKDRSHGLPETQFGRQEPTEPSKGAETTRTVPFPTAKTELRIAPALGKSHKIEYEKIIREKFDLYMAQAQQFIKAGKYYRAADSFSLAAIYDSKNPRVHLGKAHALLAAGEFMSAAFYLETAFELSPDAAQKKTDLKKFFADEEKFNARIKELDRWKERTGQPMLAFLKAYVFYQQGKFDQAQNEIPKELADTPAAKTLLNAAKASRNK